MNWRIVSGRSGSGKSICLAVLEDLGFYCIDNLPFHWIPLLLQEAHRLPAKVAISIDARNLPADPSYFAQQMDAMAQAGIRFEIIYLDAQTDRLIQRFSETRRKHPLTNAHTTLKEALFREQRLLEAISQMADLMIDTTELTSAGLRALLATQLGSHQAGDMSLLLLSFAYKFGIPSDADYVFDVRCLPNPYWDISLRDFKGFEPPIMAFMDAQPAVRSMCEQIRGFLDAWIPQYEAMNRSYMTVALGCTGGQHRSVYVAQTLGHYYQQRRPIVHIRHRELT